MENGPVEVEIYGSRYKVRGSSGPDEIRKVASYVDRRMREISDAAGGAITPLKAAVLAALNIAEELFEAREEAERRIDPDTAAEVARRVEALAGRLDAPLSEV